jgi:hypothetical protein
MLSDSNDDDFEIVEYEQTQRKPRQSLPLLADTSSKQTKGRGSIQRWQRGKASKPAAPQASSEFTVGTNAVSDKNSGSPSIGKESLGNGKHGKPRKETTSELSAKIIKDRRETQDADMLVARANSQGQDTVDSKNSDSGYLSKKFGRLRLNARKSAERKRNRKASVRDVEPDSDKENLTRKQFLHNVKDEHTVTSRGRLVNQAEPTVSGKQVLRQLSRETVSSKSESNEISKTPVRRRLTFTSAVVGTDGDGREDQAVTLSSVSSKHKANAGSKHGLIGRKSRCSPRVSAADEKQTKVGSSGSNPTCSLSAFDGGDGLTTYVTSVVCTMRESYDIAALPALTGFSSSSFITSTPLPARKRALSVNPQRADCGNTVASDLIVSMNVDCSSDAVSVPDRSNGSNKFGSSTSASKSTGKLETAAKRKRKRPQVVVMGAKRRRLTNNRSAKKSVGNLDAGFYFICLLARVCF